MARRRREEPVRRRPRGEKPAGMRVLQKAKPQLTGEPTAPESKNEKVNDALDRAGVKIQAQFPWSIPVTGNIEIPPDALGPDKTFLDILLAIRGDMREILDKQAPQDPEGAAGNIALGLINALLSSVPQMGDKGNRIAWRRLTPHREGDSGNYVTDDFIRNSIRQLETIGDAEELTKYVYNIILRLSKGEAGDPLKVFAKRQTMGRPLGEFEPPVSKGGEGAVGWRRPERPEVRYHRREEGKVTVGLAIADGVTDIDEIASIIPEDDNADYSYLLTPFQEEIKKLVEEDGYKVLITVEDIGEFEGEGEFEPRQELGPGDKIKIEVDEDLHTVKVTTPSGTHMGGWDDEENIFDVVGDHNLLKAAMIAWEGEDKLILTHEELVARGGGWV